MNPRVLTDPCECRLCHRTAKSTELTRGLCSDCLRAFDEGYGACLMRGGEDGWAFKCKHGDILDLCEPCREEERREKAARETERIEWAREKVRRCCGCEVELGTGQRFCLSCADIARQILASLPPAPVAKAVPPPPPPPAPVAKGPQSPLKPWVPTSLKYLDQLRAAVEGPPHVHTFVADESGGVESCTGCGALKGYPSTQ